MRNVSHFLDILTQWTVREKHILAAALVGSYARGTARDDSDIDVILITAQPQVYLQQDDWLDAFGRVTSVIAEDWGLVQSRRVIFDGCIEVEFGITTLAWAQIDPVDPGTRRVLADGVRILSDRGGLLASVLDGIGNNTRAN